MLIYSNANKHQHIWPSLYHFFFPRQWTAFNNNHKEYSFVPVSPLPSGGNVLAIFVNFQFRLLCFKIMLWNRKRERSIRNRTRLCTPWHPIFFGCNSWQSVNNNVPTDRMLSAICYIFFLCCLCGCRARLIPDWS